MGNTRATVGPIHNATTHTARLVSRNDVSFGGGNDVPYLYGVIPQNMKFGAEIGLSCLISKKIKS